MFSVCFGILLCIYAKIMKWRFDFYIIFALCDSIQKFRIAYQPKNRLVIRIPLYNYSRLSAFSKYPCGRMHFAEKSAHTPPQRTWRPSEEKGNFCTLGNFVSFLYQNKAQNFRFSGLFSFCGKIFGKKAKNMSRVCCILRRQEVIC